MEQASVLLSPVEAIARLRVVPFPTRPMKAMRVVRHDGIVIADLGKGRVAYSGYRGRYAYSGDSVTSQRLVEAIFRLGLITGSELDAHRVPYQERQARRRLAEAADELSGAAETLGVRLTSAQVKRLEAARLQ